MTESVFLEQLDNSLRVLPKKERRTYVAYYREMIRDRMEDGWSESEAVASLGDIDVIVGRLCAAYPEVREIEEHRRSRSIPRIAAAIAVLLLVQALLIAPRFAKYILAPFFPAAERPAAPSGDDGYAYTTDLYDVQPRSIVIEWGAGSVEIVRTEAVSN